jgi:hypothetical protein
VVVLLRHRRPVGTDRALSFVPYHGDDREWNTLTEPEHRIPDTERNGRVGCNQAEGVGSHRNDTRQGVALPRRWQEEVMRWQDQQEQRSERSRVVTVDVTAW